MIDIANEVFSATPNLMMPSFPERINKKKLVVYGLGAGYHSFNEFVLKRYELVPSIFIDQRVSNSLSEAEFSPDEFFSAHPFELFQEFYILVTIGNREVFNAIKEKFLHHGFGDVHSILDVYEYNLCYATKEMAKNLQQILKRNSGEINIAYNLLSDQKSRDIFSNILFGHWNSQPILSQSYSPENQYIVEDIGLSESNISLLDCGAYDGDTLTQFSEKYGRLNLAVALECDSKNFQKMAKKDYPKIDKLILLPLGSGDKTDKIFFENGNEMQSRLSEKIVDSGSMVNVVNCDEILRGIEFTKIVIDTEGYEKQSLNGMKEIISNFSPDITVAAYHFPADFFQIINLINSIHPKYKYYLRNHSPFVAETVLYCVKN
jgi:FkbM family methyltransferase